MYFPSMLGPTFPNRIFQLCGQTDRLDDSVDLCSYPTIFDHCRQAGVSSKYYYGNVPFLTLFPVDALVYANSFSDFLSDCASGSLPQVSFVDPSFTLVLNTANDNHPHSDIRNGDALMAQVYNAVATSPDMEEHRAGAEPRRVGWILRSCAAAARAGAQQHRPDLVDGKALLGCRRPAPWHRPGPSASPSNPTVNHTVYDHTSVLKMIESVFNVKPLAARETSSDVGNLLSLIDFANKPKAAPALPQPQPVPPQKICASSINPGGGLRPPRR